MHCIPKRREECRARADEADVRFKHTEEGGPQCDPELVYGMVVYADDDDVAEAEDDGA